MDGTRPLRILVADDLPDSADSLALLLKVVGHEVEVAYDGEECLAKASSARFDAVLLDIGMPKVDGYRVAKQKSARARPARIHSS